jgi:hypothetical protein
MRGVRSLLLLAIALGSLILLLSNRTPLAIQFLTAVSLPLPLGVWLLVALLAGVLTTLILRLLVSGLGGSSTTNRGEPSPGRRESGRWFGQRGEASEWAVKDRRGSGRSADGGQGKEVWDQADWSGGRGESAKSTGDRRPPVVEANYRVVSDPGTSAPGASSSTTGRSPEPPPKTPGQPKDDWDETWDEDWS